MPNIKIDGKLISTDEQGFLRDPERWNEDLATSLALHMGIEELTQEHWNVLHYIRGYYLEHGNAPLIRSICAEAGMTLRRIFQLFPQGPAQGACKIAGLPKPDGCI